MNVFHKEWRLRQAYLGIFVQLQGTCYLARDESQQRLRKAGTRRAHETRDVITSGPCILHPSPTDKHTMTRLYNHDTWLGAFYVWLYP
jgi:tartrate dehydratase beta subunit/fumarate hydratase class I family protein